MTNYWVFEVVAYWKPQKSLLFRHSVNPALRSTTLQTFTNPWRNLKKIDKRDYLGIIIMETMELKAKPYYCSCAAIRRESFMQKILNNK
jgi:hypothetical protein